VSSLARSLAEPVHVFETSSLVSGLGFVGRRRRDDDPFGAALASRLTIPDFDALAFMCGELGRFDRFRSLANRGAVLKNESLLAFFGLDDELGCLVVDLVERADQRPLGRLLADGRLDSIGRGVRQHAGGTNRTRHRQD
jgi:hypothetical protein